MTRRTHNPILLFFLAFAYLGGLFLAGTPPVSFPGGENVISEDCSIREPASSNTPVIAFNFDWDDNIMKMPTPLVLFHRGSGEPKELSTKEYAEERSKIGLIGKWKGYERRSGIWGTYRNFLDVDRRNVFLRDVRHAVEDMAPEKWQGPSWQAFVKALSHPETAARTTIITARGHSPKKMMQALEYLKRKGLITHLPPLENLTLLGQPKLKNTPEQISEKKLEKIIELLDALQKEPVPARSRRVLNQNGDSKKALHLWGFSDDDFKTYKLTSESLVAAIKENPNRWSRIKITLFYTGKKNPEVSPHADILTSFGTLRPQKPGEFNDVAHLLRHDCSVKALGID